MPPPSSRMTKNRAQPTRYRPGKAEAEDPQSEDESSEEEDDDERPAAAARAPPPKATTFPKKLAVDVSKAGQQVTKPAAPQAEPSNEDLEGFETASESSDEDNGAKGSGSESEEDSSEEEDSSSDDEPAKPMLRPTFISKAKRTQQEAQQQLNTSTAEDKPALDPETVRQEKTDALLAAHLARDAAARAAGKKYWDDDDIAPEDEVDDTDDLDPEAELAAWKLRELKRVRRDRAAIEEKEKEREEIERRRNLTAEEREAEDQAFIEAQKEGREDRGKMGYMQKYFHKGAFFGGDRNDEVDEEVANALNRDLAGAKFEDETGDKSVLPEYMRVRDMTRLGRKGRSKYKDLKSEDTGRWGAEVGRRKREFGEVQDERFRPDDERGGGGREREGPTGANSAALGERKRARYE